MIELKPKCKKIDFTQILIYLNRTFGKGIFREEPVGNSSMFGTWKRSVYQLKIRLLPCPCKIHLITFTLRRKFQSKWRNRNVAWQNPKRALASSQHHNQANLGHPAIQLQNFLPQSEKHEQIPQNSKYPHGHTNLFSRLYLNTSRYNPCVFAFAFIQALFRFEKKEEIQEFNKVLFVPC